MSTSSKSTKAQLLAHIAELESANAALEARLTIARTSFRAQRDTIRELEAKLNTRGVIATESVAPDEFTRAPARHAIAPIVTRFTKHDGSVWEKTRIGNRSVSRQLIVYHA